MSYPDKILQLAGGSHQDILAKLEDKQAATIVSSWQQARVDIEKRITSLYDRTFAAGATPTPAQLLQFTRDGELVAGIDAHLDALGVKTQGAQTGGFSAGAALAKEQLSVEMSPLYHDFGHALPSAVSFARLDNVVYDLGMTRAINETPNMVAEVRSAVHRELAAGAIAGEGIKELAARIEPMSGIGANRADIISRYAVISGHNAAREQAYADAVPAIPGLQKMWLVTRDERTCPLCLAHWGEAVPVEAEFDHERTFGTTAPKIYGGTLSHPPLHPRCRCTITTWHPRWYGLTDLTPEFYQEEAQKLAIQAGLPSKTFAQEIPPVSGLRATRAGRNVLRASEIKSVPPAVRQAYIDKFFSCFGGKSA